MIKYETQIKTAKTRRLYFVENLLGACEELVLSQWMQQHKI
jgi:hypothetical protein